MYDVAIIGAGVVGAAAARELSRRRLSIVVCERGTDAAGGASRANSGIVHAGHDARPGSLKARYNLAGNPLFDRLSQELDFPFSRIGSLVLALDDGEIGRLQTLRERGIENGVAGLEIIPRDELRRLEPNINPGAAAALLAPGGGIVCPYEMTIALAEGAAVNGVEFRFNHRVEHIARLAGEGFEILASDGSSLRAKVLINAAGLYSDRINNLLSGHKLELRPRRGEYCLLDRSEAGLVRHTLFQLPGGMGKGVLITPTTDGNLLVGPTSEETEDREDTETTREGLRRLLETAARDLAHLPADKIITSFAGLRAHLPADDFVAGPAPDVPGLINFCGIESPGLTSAPALAIEAGRLVDAILAPPSSPGFVPTRRRPPGFRRLDRDGRRALIARNPDYGRLVCRCEQVSRGEIIDALRSPLAPRDLGAVKRRTRAGMGRCQGGFCSMRLPGIIAGELGIPLTEVRQAGPGSEILRRKNKTDPGAG